MPPIDPALIYTDDNRAILRKYLVKHFGKERALHLYKKNNGEWFDRGNLAYALGKRDLSFFCHYFLQDTFIPKPDNRQRNLAPVHYEVWDTLSDMFVKDQFDKLELVMPRGSAKTAVCDFALSVWAHCYEISKYTLVAGHTENDALEFIRDTRRALEESPYIIYTFGKLIDARNLITNKLELELTNNTKVQAISSTSSIRGKKYDGSRPTIIIADDYQSKADITTQDARDKKYKMWVEDSYYAGDKAVIRNGEKIKMGTKFIVLGTILHSDCFISRLLADKTYKHILRKAVLVDDIDEHFNSGLWAEFKKRYFNAKDPNALDNAIEFYYQNEEVMKYPVLWADKYDCLETAIDYYVDPQAFKQEMMNDASKIGPKAFRNATKMSPEEIESQTFTKSILVCDPAVEAGKRNDYTALAVASLTQNNFRWIRKGIIKRIEFDDYIKEAVNLLRTYEDITHVWIEKNTFNGTDARALQKEIDTDPALRARKIKILNERQHKNKEAKIRAISGKVDSGFIIFNEEDTEAIDQLLAYEGEGYSKHDDFADVVAEADRLLDEIEVLRPVQFLPRNWLF